MAIKKLIEVALPLEKINAAAAYEKMPGIGEHPRGLHLWWSRKPLAAARAVIWASLVDDPSSHEGQFPTVEEQNAERQRLFKILESLVVWENSNNEEVLEKAKAEIKKSVGDETIKLLDPFAGGGAIPLEAQRLGLEAHAHDLNPVAVMINKAMIEIPPRFANLPPVNPDYRDKLGLASSGTPRSSCGASPPLKGGQEGEWQEWRGAAGLAEDVRYYGEWLKNEAYKKIGHLYPKVKVPKEQGGGEATVIAWIWARTVKCPNPACGVMMPLVNSWELSKKKGKEAWIEPSVESGERRAESGDLSYGSPPFQGGKSREAGSGDLSSNSPPFQGGKPREAGQGGTSKKIVYTVKTQGRKPEPAKIGKGIFRCVSCGEAVKTDYIREQFLQEKNGVDLIAIVAEGKNGRIYISPNEEHREAANCPPPDEKPEGYISKKLTGGSCVPYGLDQWYKLFTNRQLTTLTTFSDLIAKAQTKAETDAKAAGFCADDIPLAAGGTGAKAYGEAISVYLAFAIDRLADFSTAISRWSVSNEKAMNCFSKQSIPMTWGYPEANPFGKSVGSFEGILKYIVQCINTLPQIDKVGGACQFDAQSDCSLRNIIISTDPPYYDNIGYADLSDFFYVWMRQSLKGIYPELFKTLLVPKSEELIATPYRHDGSKAEAKEFFENGMFAACQQLYKYARNDVPVTIYYAYKEGDMSNESSGWETMLSSIIKAGFAITGTWPMRTEQAYRSTSMGTNALASSIVLVCRKRENAPTTTRRNFINELKRVLPDALDKLQKSNIAPVDLAQSAIGPGMAIFSKYKQVLEADGLPMMVRSALQLINQELDLFFDGQDGELDRDSRFCVKLYTQCAFNDIPFGEADTLSRAKNTSIAAMTGKGIIYAKKSVAHLVVREELPEKVDNHEETIWLLTQQLTRAMERGGVQSCASIIAPMLGANVEQAKSLAYRIYTIAEKKGWAQEAYAYNSLVASWPDIQSRAAQIAEEKPKQTTIFDDLANAEN